MLSNTSVVWQGRIELGMNDSCCFDAQCMMLWSYFGQQSQSSGFCASRAASSVLVHQAGAINGVSVIHSRRGICCLLSVIFAYAGVSMSLAGEHQLQNAATAVTAVLALRDLSLLPSITTSMVLKGLEEASLPGRFQVRALLPISSNQQAQVLQGQRHPLTDRGQWLRTSSGGEALPCQEAAPSC